MKFNTAFNGLILATVSKYVVTSQNLRGTTPSSTAENGFPVNYEEYLNHLQQVDHSFPIPDASSSCQPGMLCASGPSLIQATLPDGVFDIEKIKNSGYMMTLPGRCSDAINENSPASDVLGCHLLFDPSWDIQPLAIGTLSMGTNLYDGTDNKGYFAKNQINPIFKDYAQATMIQSGCYQLDTSRNTQDESDFQFSDVESYKSSLKTSSSTSVDTKANAFFVSTTAGYNTMSSQYTSDSSTNKYAYGEHKWSAPVGILNNICLESESYFKDVILNNELITEDTLQNWNTIKKETDASNLAKSSAFQDVANGGLQMPSTYHYGAAVSYIIEAWYESLSEETSKDMSDAVSAGLGVNFAGIGASVSTTVTNSINEAAESSDVKQSNTVTVKAWGKGVNTGCIQNNTCPQMLTNQVDAMRNDLNNLGIPLGVSTYIDLHRIVSWYTGEELGATFDEALNTYFAYAQCEDMYSSSNKAYQMFNGSGEQQSTSTCSATDTVCNSSYLNVSEMAKDKIQKQMCSTVTYSKCAAGSNPHEYEKGKNGYVNSMGGIGYCDAGFVCRDSSSDKDYGEYSSTSSICKATLTCKSPGNGASGKNCFKRTDGKKIGTRCCRSGTKCKKGVFAYDNYHNKLCKA